MSPFEFNLAKCEARAWEAAAASARYWIVGVEFGSKPWPEADRLLGLEAFFRLMAIVRTP